jgi:uncharacterized protein YjdB
MELFKSRTRVAYTNAVGDKVYPVIVDIKRGIKSTEDIQFVSSDIRTGVISVALMHNNAPYNVYGCKVLCTVLRPDASMFEVECECIQDNIIEIELGAVGTRLDGIYSFDIKIHLSETKTVGTPQMSYSVAQSLDMDDFIMEDDRVPILTSLITQTEEAVDAVEQSLDRVVSLESEMQGIIQEGRETVDEVVVTLSNVNTALGEVEGAIVRLDGVVSKGEQDIADAIASIPSKEELKGDKGEKGDNGITPNIKVGKVVTLEPTEQANVERVGTLENPIFNFYIPRGIDGSGEGSGDGHTHSNLSVINSITQTKVNEWNNKADATHTHNVSEIEGLDNINIDLSNYYTKSETDEVVNNKADKVHTHSQYLTEHQDISYKADKVDTYTKTETDNKISEEITKAQLGGSGEVDLSAYATKTFVNEEISKIEVGDKHTHSNLSVLNSITQIKVNEWNGKAPSNHSHTEYASSSHTHSNYANTSHTHTEYASTNHTHNYASASHTHSDYANKTHTHTDYANKTHTHSTSDISNLSSYVSSLITNDTYINSLKSTIDTLSSELTKVKTDIEALKNNSGSANIPVTGINCSEWEVNLQVGQTRQIIASVIPSSATNKLIHWYSDNTLAVDVSSNGLITAKGVGYSKVTATTDDGGHKYDIRVTVTASSGGGSGSTTTSGIKVTPASVSIERGKTVDVTISFGSDVINKNIECMSSSGAIASVSDLGSHRYRITGVGQGQTSIRFRTSDGRFEVSCSVTVTAPSSGGGSGMTSNEYEESCKSEYILDKMYPMGQAHEAIPNGNITGWKYNSRWENQDRPYAMAHSCGQSGCPGTGAFQALGCWSNIYRVEGTPFTQNTGVEMKDIKVYGWYNGAWELVQHLPVPNGNFYAESFSGDSNRYFGDSVKQSSTSKTIILREKNKIDAMNWNTGQLQSENCMYHPFSDVKNFDTKYEYIYTCIDLRKVKWDENGVDDRDQTYYCSNCGGDWWLKEGLMFHDSWQHNKGVCQPKMVEITNEWRRFSMTTVPQSWSNGFPK